MTRALSLSAAAIVAMTSIDAGAASIGLEVLVDGQDAGWYNQSVLGCSDSTGGPTFTCQGSTPIQIGGSQGMSLDSWNLSLDSDPVVSGIVAVTNLNPNVSQQFTLIFTLPIAAIPGGTVMGGSIQGGETDNDGNGVTLSTAAGSSFYTARIDGADVQTLYGDPQSFSAGSFLSGNVPNIAFGTPIPSMPGPAALTSIGIRLDFVLTPSDSASFTSNFVVQPAPVPVPGAVWLLGSAIGLLGVVRRRATW